MAVVSNLLLNAALLRLGRPQRRPAGGERKGQIAILFNSLWRVQNLLQDKTRWSNSGPNKAGRLTRPRRSKSVKPAKRVKQVKLRSCADGWLTRPRRCSGQGRPGPPAAPAQEKRRRKLFSIGEREKEPDLADVYNKNELERKQGTTKRSWIDSKSDIASLENISGGGYRA
jgi:hypothetical protein